MTKIIDASINDRKEGKKIQDKNVKDLNNQDEEDWKSQSESD